MNKYTVRTSVKNIVIQAENLEEARFNACIELYNKVPQKVETNLYSGWSQGYADGNLIGRKYFVMKAL